MVIYYSYNLSIRNMSGNNLIKNILENHRKHAKTNKQKDFFLLLYFLLRVCFILYPSRMTFLFLQWMCPPKFMLFFVVVVQGINKMGVGNIFIPFQISRQEF